MSLTQNIDSLATRVASEVKKKSNIGHTHDSSTITSVDWSTLTNKPTDIMYISSFEDSQLPGSFAFSITGSASYADTAGGVSWLDVSSTPTTIVGYGITDAYTKSEVYSKSEVYTKAEVNSLTSSIVTNLSSLSDVSFTTKAVSDIIRWNGTKWVNSTLAAAGIQPAGSYLTGNQIISVSGDATGSGTTSIALTLANSGVTAGTYNSGSTGIQSFTVDAKGRITGVGSSTTITPAWSSITSKPTTLSGYGITDSVISTQDSSTDLNNITTSGVYRVQTNAHIPDGVGYGQLIVMHGGSDTYAQMYFGYQSSDAVYVRTGSGTSTVTWSAWVKLASTAGSVTSAGALTAARTISATGDATWSVSFDGSANVSSAITLSSSGVTAGTYNSSATAITPYTVDAKGRITATGSAVTITPAWTSITGRPTALSSFTNDSGYITSSGNAATASAVAWSGITSKPTTLSGFGITDAVSSSLVGAVSGVAPLDATGKIASSYLPSYVDDVLEYSALASFPATGETGKIYVDVATNKIYRWTGSVYVEISPTVGNSDTATKLAIVRTLSATGDATWSVSFDGSANVSSAITLAASGVTAGTYNNSATAITPYTVDAKGRVTATGSAVTITPAWASITGKPTALSSFTNDSGYITSSGSISGNAATATTATSATTATTAKGVGTVDPSIGTGGLWVTSASGLNIARNSTSYIALDSGNYTSYAPSLTGTGASGTWGISISGNAATASLASSVAWANVANKPTALSYFTNDVGYITSSGSISGNAATATTATNATNASYATTASSATTATYLNSGTSSTDVTNITTRVNSGFYQNSAPTIATGWPVETNWYHMIASTHSNTSNYYSMQLAASFHSNTLFYRSTNGSGTTGWSRVLLDNNYNSYAPSLTGSGASGTWGISITGSAGSVSWANVSGKPTALSSFTNDSGYITSSGSISGNAATATNAATAGTVSISLSGTNAANAVYTTIADNDFFRIRVGGDASNAGWAEIATSDDGNEPIYVRQYTGVFANVARTLTLLDGSGNTSVPGALTAASISATNVTGNETYANGWFRNNASGSGLYNQVTGAGIYSDAASWIKTYNSNFGVTGDSINIGLGLNNNEKRLGFHTTGRNCYFYYNSNNDCGLYDATGGYVRWNSDVNGAMSIRSSLTIGGNVAIHAGNIASYVAGNTYSLTSAFGNNYTWTNSYNQFLSNKGASSYLGANNSYNAQFYSNDGGAAAFSFHRGGEYAVNMGLDPDNVLRIGGWSAGANLFNMDMSGNLTMANNVTAYSDIRLKKDIVRIESALAKVHALNGVTYTRIDNDARQTGLIAQEVQKVLPEAVIENSDEMKTLSVAYGNLAGLLVEAVKEVDDKLDSKVKRLEEIVEKQQKLLDILYSHFQDSLDDGK